MLIILVFGAAFQLFVYLGGTQEMKNSVDASTLNTAKRATLVKTSVKEFDDSGRRCVYADVADSTNKFGLNNINRLWGMDYLINANAQAMQQDGFGTALANNNARIANDQAIPINAQLYQLLLNKKSFDPYFTQISTGKPARLLGTSGSVSTNDNYEFGTACLYRGEESNITYDPLEIPHGVVPNSIQMNNQLYMQGYNPSEANNSYFCFTTFHANEAPHLVSHDMFSKWQKASLDNAVNPIPNCFMEGGGLSGKVAVGTAACAVANPLRTFQLAIPHSYVTISLRSTAVWYVEGIKVNETPYGPLTGTVWGAHKIKLGKASYWDGNRSIPDQGVLDGYANLGNEYKPSTLWQAINATPADHSAIINILLQRIKEFKPGFTASDLQQLLQQQSILPARGQAAPPQIFYIFPTYDTTDNTDPIVKVGAALSITSPPPNAPGWLVPTTPEGLEKDVFKETGGRNINPSWSVISGPYPTDDNWTTTSGTFSWSPGTGFQQNLGALRISRVTTVWFTGGPPNHG